MPPNAPSPWWTPDRHADRRPRLVARSAILRAIRRWFEDQGFIEVETPILQMSPGNETHLHAFKTHWQRPDGEYIRYYLHTSPEFSSKKLLTAGERRIFTFARVFRDREWTDLHHPEFTMLEWYRTDAPYEMLMADCEGLLHVAAQAAHAAAWRHGDMIVPVAQVAERLSVVEAFRRHVAVDLVAMLPDRPDARSQLEKATRTLGLHTAEDDTWSDLFSRILSDRVEPNLGRGAPTILDRYPVSEAALARPCPDDARFAERFELYLCGVELANAFGELTDPVEQRGRFEAAMNEKERVYGERYPIDEDFLAALAIMPPASGIALGFDRLVMLATGAKRITDVLWAPVAGTER